MSTAPAPSTAAAFDLAAGFRAAAVACGLRSGDGHDLTLIASDRAASAAGVFTTNRVQAAPVLYDREVLARDPAAIRAVIANAGCANACTGEPGMAATRRTAALVAAAIGCTPEQVLVLSTGVIGRALDMAKVERGIAALAAAQATRDGVAAGGLGAERGGAAAARAIMTTDTRPKTAAEDVTIDGRTIAIRGMAKGAGMIHPHMATMLSVLTTDAAIAPGALQTALAAAVKRSFNRVSVDGDMSTNDTVLLLASGASGVTPAGAALESFTAALTRVSTSLARQIARDGEGATRLVTIAVTGARDETEAHTVADSIARSPLVKTAIHGGDPNWGRVLCAAGYSGAAIDPQRLSLAFGEGPRAIMLVKAGLPLAFDAAAASALLELDPVIIRLDLGLGAAEATVWTCDLSAEYVAINAHYTT
ncbi:MAG: bifunctional glutamate N-acetyltransferase/amino-acid acetyltransferase ArgJ [Candidatus Eisenbacteria bacterium]|nr:bifunctional glutamate N-acetyltransferase/amino-acid acetyltransferase ArgJ [Candidatus Eisenbacteria bacterium]